MLEKREVDDHYNKIYDLMEEDFKGWATCDILGDNSGKKNNN
jgi:hypothetical protein